MWKSDPQSEPIFPPLTTCSTRRLHFWCRRSTVVAEFNSPDTDCNLIERISRISRIIQGTHSATFCKGKNPCERNPLQMLDHTHANLSARPFFRSPDEPIRRYSPTLTHSSAGPPSRRPVRRSSDVNPFARPQAISYARPLPFRVPVQEHYGQITILGDGCPTAVQFKPEASTLGILPRGDCV